MQTMRKIYVRIRKIEQILKRSTHVIGERNTAELVVIAEELLPQIEEGLHKSETGTYAISMTDIIEHVPFARKGKGLLSLESLFCVLSSVNWRNHIFTGISYDAEDFSLYLYFRRLSGEVSEEEEPSIKNCTEKWMRVYDAPAIIEQGITKDSVSKWKHY